MILLRCLIEADFLAYRSQENVTISLSPCGKFKWRSELPLTQAWKGALL